MSAPTDNLVRSRYDTGAAELRAGSDGRTLFGHFAVFDQWTRINSRSEGTFMERNADTSFTRTFAQRGQRVRVLYDHGSDPSIGNKPLGAPDVLRVEPFGAYYESELFRANYVDELIPALTAGQLGASYRFAVVADEWVTPKRATDHNPEMLKERTVLDVELYEFGPVTFPAYENATAGVRSGTDSFIERLLNDPAFVARFTERCGGNVVANILAGLPAVGGIRADQQPSLIVPDGPTRTLTQRKALVASLTQR